MPQIYKIKSQKSSLESISLRGRFNLQVQHFSQKYSDQPEMGDAYYSLGLLQAEMGNYEKSAITLQKATELSPFRSRIWFNLYNLLEFKNNTSEAQNALEKCLELEPRNLEFLYAKIEFLLKQKRKNEAVNVAKIILEYYPDSPDKDDLQNFIDLNS